MRKGSVGEDRREEAEQIEAGRVRPVQVVQQENKGPVGGEGGEEILHLYEEGHLAGDGPHRAPVGEGGGQRGDEAEAG